MTCRHFPRHHRRGFQGTANLVQSAKTLLLALAEPPEDLFALDRHPHLRPVRRLPDELLLLERLEDWVAVSAADPREGESCLEIAEPSRSRLTRTFAADSVSEKSWSRASALTTADFDGPRNTPPHHV